MGREVGWTCALYHPLPENDLILGGDILIIFLGYFGDDHKNINTFWLFYGLDSFEFLNEQVTFLLE